MTKENMTQYIRSVVDPLIKNVVDLIQSIRNIVNDLNGLGLGSFCKVIDNWNNATTNGWFMGEDILNAPTTGWCMGYVIAKDANTVEQHVCNTLRPKMWYTRTKYNGIWQAWTGALTVNYVSTLPPSGGQENEIWMQIL